MDDMIRRLHKLSTSIRLKVDRFLPRHCLLCQQTDVYSSICDPCTKDLPRTTQACHICGQSVVAEYQPLCGACLSHPPRYRRSVSAFNYAFPVDAIVQSLKYHEKGYWARPIALAAFDSFNQAFGHLNRAQLIPVPMHMSQYQHRRDNHAELICRHLSQGSGLPMLNNLVIKHRQTPRQAELSAKARARNLQGSFSLRQTPPKSVPMILVDDVVTTGNTLNILTQLLQSNGVEEVYGFSIARKSLE